MRIAIFTDTFLPQINGVVTSTINLANGLADRGHRVYIFAPKYKIDKEFKHKNVKVIRKFGVPALFYEDFKFVAPSPQIIKYLKENKVDIIHMQTPLSLGMQAIISGKYLKKPIVGTFHTFFGDREYLRHVYMDNKIGEGVAWIYSNMFYNNCDLITSPSAKTREELLKHGAKKEVKVISNGLDISSFDNSKSKNIKKKYSLLGPTFLFIGRVAYEKSLDVALKSFKIINDKHKDSKFIIVGHGPQFDEIKKEVNSLGLNDSVIMLGAIPRDKLVKSGIFGAVDIYLTASKTENQPVTVMEAIANGLPCVGVNSKGMSNVITNNKTGFVVKPDNIKAIANAGIKLIEDKKLYAQMRDNCFEDIKKDDIENVIDIWEKVYSKLISSKK